MLVRNGFRNYFFKKCSADFFSQQHRHSIADLPHGFRPCSRYLVIRSDRQGIIWESDYGRALQTWGANLIKEVGKMSKEPRRKRVREIFLEKSNIVARATETFEDKDVAKAAVILAEQLGSFANEDSLEEGSDDNLRSRSGNDSNFSTRLQI